MLYLLFINSREKKSGGVGGRGGMSSPKPSPLGNCIMKIHY